MVAHRSSVRRSILLLLAIVPATSALAAPAHASSPFGIQPVADTMLGRIAGREDTGQAAFSAHTATVTGNSVGEGVVTGEVNLSETAFQNLTGLSAININTGNNVAVNSALNVNISIVTAP